VISLHEQLLATDHELLFSAEGETMRCRGVGKQLSFLPLALLATLVERASERVWTEGEMAEVCKGKEDRGGRNAGEKGVREGTRDEGQR
jgi:hypothetical protein